MYAQKIKKAWSHKLYFSTDLTLDAHTVLKHYRSRFQIEFLYRDAKQHTGLEDVQARSENKLDFTSIYRFLPSISLKLHIGCLLKKIKDLHSQ